MSHYPTPPPTSSPKDHINHDHHQHIHHDTYHSYSPPNLPAQESYFQSYSAPSSPKHYYAPPPQPNRINSDPKPRPYDTTNVRPQRRRTPPPRPIYYSPTNKPPSPYNTARPRPRPGFVKRITAKIEEWVRGFIRWAKKNPVKAGIATFVPLVALAGFAKAVHGVVRLGSELLSSIDEDRIGGKDNGKDDDEDEEGKKEKEKKVYGWGMDHFVGFGGSKGGPVDGMMKILQMLVNHYCKLTPSMVPRLGSILLELYFLDKVH